MNDQWARLIEAERRIAALQADVRRRSAELIRVGQDVRTIARSGPSGTGGLLVANVHRWESAFCYTVNFESGDRPTLDLTKCDDPAWDLLAFNHAVSALRTPYSPPYTGGDPEELRIYYSTTVNWYAGKPWFFLEASRINDTRSFDISRPPLSLDVHFTCAYSLTALPVVGEVDEFDIEDEYVSGCRPKFLSLPVTGGSLDTPSLEFQPAVFDDGFSPPVPVFKMVSFPFRRVGADPGEEYGVRAMLAMYDADPENPLKALFGPKHGTEGYYDFPARIWTWQSWVDGGIPFSEAGDFLLNDPESPTLRISWGLECEGSGGEPPSPEKYEDLCDAIRGTVYALPGLIVRFNGTHVAGGTIAGGGTGSGPGGNLGLETTLGEYATSPTISFELDPLLQELLYDYPDLILSYEWAARCADVPFSPITGSGVIQDGTSIVLSRNTTCDGRPVNSEYEIWFRLASATGRENILDEVCCVGPDPSRCGTDELLSFAPAITWVLTPGIGSGDSLDGGSPGDLPVDVIDGGTPGDLPTDIIDGGGPGDIGDIEGSLDGGSPSDLPTDILDGGSPGSLPTDIIDGGEF